MYGMNEDEIAAPVEVVIVVVAALVLVILAGITLLYIFGGK